jgi:titin
VVTLGWSAPTSNGGSAVTSYTVLRSTTSGTETVLTTGVTGLTYNDTSAVNGTTYFYEVKAVNVVGSSVASNEKSATPATVPGAPTLNSATGGNNVVTLGWSAPSNNGGSTVTSYTVLRSTTSGTETVLTTGVTGLTYNDTSAVNGMTYFYEVEAVNGVGTGAHSNEMSATPQATTSNLAVSLSAPGLMVAGFTGSWRVTVTNNGNTATSGTLKITDTLPAQLRYSSVSGTTGWSCSASGQNVTCTVTESLAAHVSQQFSLVLVAKAGSAFSLYSVSDTVVLTPGNKTATATTRVLTL